MKNSNKKTLLILSLIRLAFRVCQIIFPTLAKRWAAKLFFSPTKFAYPPKEMEVIAASQKFNFVYKDKNLHGYSWGEGPIVLFIHGWAGRGGQVVEMVNPLLAEGFRIVSFDAPAHGNSSGKVTDILEFSECILLLEKNLGNIYGAVGHSLGGVALLLARKNGLKLKKLITVGSPSLSDGIIHEFLKKIGGKPEIGTYIKNYVKRRYNQSFEEFSASYIVSHPFPSSNILLVHDEDDKDAPFYHFQELKKKLPGAENLITKDLGHTRILRNAEVVRQIVDFINTPTLRDKSTILEENHN